MKQDGGDSGVALTGPVAVCICTFRRPKQLARLLSALLSITRPPCVCFVIVDNDGDDPAVEVLVAKFRAEADAPVEFLVERCPGISAARNAAVAAARRMGARAIAMLDDDEWPSRDWLQNLVAAREASGAAIVGGPVEPVFQSVGGVPKEFRKLWSVRAGRLNGKTYVYCTCNCLIDLHAIVFLGDRPFPEDFGASGGEDTVFFRQLFFGGLGMAWAEEAVVFEEIPTERASLTWMRRRWFRHGNVGVRCEQAVPGPGDLSPLLKTILLCLRFPLYPLLSRSSIRSPFLWVLEAERIRGRIAAHLGVMHEEYGRLPPAS